MTHSPNAQIETRRAQATQALRPVRGEYPFESHFHPLPEGAAGSGSESLYLHYLDEGPRDAEPLVFLHGNPTWSFAWRRVIRRLSGRYRCIALDHIGCGLSDKPRDYPYRLLNHVENAQSLIHALGLERFTLVAHDWGGAIAMGVARRLPQRVERLCLANTAAFPFGRIPWRIAACRLPVFGKLAVRGFNAFARAATFMTVERPLPPTVKRGYLLPYDGYGNRVAVSAFVQDIPMAKGHPSRSELEAIAAALPRFEGLPIRFLWGMRDWCFTPAFLEQWLRFWPNAEVRRFDNAGHYVFEDAASEFEKELADFLESHPVRAASPTG